jgi:GAF domain-containing protein
MHPELDETIEEILRDLLELARRSLSVDVAFVGRFADGRRELLTVSAGDPAVAASLEGIDAPLDETYCARIVDRSLPEVTPDTSLVPELVALAVTDTLRIGSYIGVPVGDGHGGIFGTVCAYSHGPLEEVSPEDLASLEAVGRLLEHWLGAWNRPRGA